MKKTAKNAQSKRNKQRKLIQIKQSKEISPVKQVLQPEQSKHIPNTKKFDKIKIPSLAKHEYEFSTSEIESISSQADPLISVELMKKIIEKQQTELKKKFIMNCPPIMQKAFGRALKNVQKSLNIIKQERVQRMKQETVIFVPPDRDNFQKHKGKALNNWMKQILYSYQQKRNFDKFSEIYRPIFINAEQKIKKLSLEVRRQKIQPDLQRMANHLTERNYHQLQSRLAEGCSQMRQIMEIADEMRRSRLKISRQMEKNGMKRKLQEKKIKWKKYQSHSILLYGVKDYFF